MREAVRTGSLEGSVPIEEAAWLDEPWDAAVMPPGDDPAYRMVVFGAGTGC